MGHSPMTSLKLQKLQHLTTRYALLEGLLYKMSYLRNSDPYLRCLKPEEVRSVMQEIHDCDYGNNVRG